MKIKLKNDNQFAAVIFAAVAFFYLQCVFFAFLSYDDNYYIVKNPLLSATFANYLKLWIPASIPREMLYIPVTYTVFFLEKLFFGPNPLVFHAFNVLFHSINSMLVFFICRRIGMGRAGALVASVIFAFHPLQAEPVAWVMGAKDVLAVFLVLLSSLCFINWRVEKSFKFYLIGIGLLLLSMLSKPSTLLIPVVFIVVDLFYEKISGREDMTRKFRGFVWHIPAFVSAVIVYILNQMVSNSYQPAKNYAYLILSIPILAFHWLKSLFLPFDLKVYYSWPEPATINSDAGVACAVCVILAISVFFLYKRVSRKRVFGLLIFGVAVSFLPSALVVFRGSEFFTADRYAYLPLVFFAVAAGLVFDEKIKSAKLARIAFISYLGVISVFTFSEIGRWHDSIRLMSSEAERNPSNDKVLYYLAVACQENAKYGEAELNYLRCIELNPRYWKAYVNLGAIYHKNGFYADAAKCFEKALSVNPGENPYVLFNLAETYLRLDRIEDALASFRKAMERKSDFHEPAFRIYQVLIAENRREEAINFAKSLLENKGVDVRKTDNTVRDKEVIEQYMP